MIEIAKGKGGFPWHGLYRAATGKITTPTGLQIDAPWSSYFINTGHCYMVQIPGLPVPTTTPEDQAKGMSWVNYALLSGAARTLYGVELGSDASIYIDSHNNPWLMRVSLGGSRASAAIGAAVSLRRFGKIGPVEAPINYSMVTAAFSTSASYPYSGWSWAEHFDISRDGRQHLIGIARDGSAVPGNWLGYACIAKLSVEGSPDDGDVAIIIEIIADETAENWGGIPVWSGAGGVYPYFDTVTNATGVSYGSPDYSGTKFYFDTGGLPGSGGLDFSRLMIGGARFNSNGSPEVVMFRAAYKRQLILDSETIGDRSYTQVGRDIESVLMHMEIGGVSVAQSGLTRSTDFTQTRAYPSLANYSATEVTNEGGTTYNRSYSAPNSIMSATGHGGFFGFSIASPSQLEKYGITQRLSNTVYSMRSWGYSTVTQEISSSRFIFGPAVGIGGKDLSMYALSAGAYGDHPIYASEHPVTGTVVRSTSPVCWV